MNWLVTVAIKAVLEWLLSLLVRLRELEQKKQEGRQEVIDDLAKRETEVDKALEELRNTSITDDAGRDELLNRADRHYGSNNLSDDRPSPTSGN